MTLESKKVTIARWVLSLADEATLDRLAELAHGTVSVPAAQDRALPYATEIEAFVDLEELKRAQGFVGVDRGKVERLIREANIEQSIEELLADLD